MFFQQLCFQQFLLFKLMTFYEGRQEGIMTNEYNLGGGVKNCQKSDGVLYDSSYIHAPYFPGTINISMYLLLFLSLAIFSCQFPYFFVPLAFPGKYCQNFSSISHFSIYLIDFLPRVIFCLPVSRLSLNIYFLLLFSISRRTS